MALSAHQTAYVNEKIRPSAGAAAGAGVGGSNGAGTTPPPTATPTTAISVPYTAAGMAAPTLGGAAGAGIGAVSQAMGSNGTALGHLDEEPPKYELPLYRTEPPPVCARTPHAQHPASAGASARCGT